jgi:hypothetical protein
MDVMAELQHQRRERIHDLLNLRAFLRNELDLHRRSRPRSVEEFVEILEKTESQLNVIMERMH